ncbi:MAG: hypothetical protein AAB316_19040 [Bacteroidota bacterium]
MPDLKLTADTVMNELTTGALLITNDMFKRRREEAQLEINKFLTESEADFKKWTKAVETGKMKESDLEFLMKTKKDGFECLTLVNIGVGKIRLNRYRNRLFLFAFQTVLKAALPVV